MATGVKTKARSVKARAAKARPAKARAARVQPATKAAIAPAAARQVLYLYAVSPKPKTAPPLVSSEGIDGEAAIEGIVSEGYTCWVSRVSHREFAERLTQNMQKLDWLASVGLRHQRVVSAIAEKLLTLPARFGTVFLTEDSMAQHVRERKRSFAADFDRVTGADEWGIKVFSVPGSKSTAASSVVPSTGIDYLKHKAAGRRSASGREGDPEVLSFVNQLGALAVDASPGGKASAGQPGLVWYGSVLVRRKDRKKLEAVLKKFAGRWQDSRRIDWSGPWPPYSFVGRDAD